MKLRKLRKDDAEFMLEWMHNADVTTFMQTDFLSKTINDCYDFIEQSQNDKRNLHLAIVDEKDVYMGTVSLKSINEIPSVAEFAITIRSLAMGKHYAEYGMNEIINIGLHNLHLNKIVWCVSKYNKRALRFYEKNGYRKMKRPFNFSAKYTEKQSKSLIWYEVIKCFRENDKKRSENSINEAIK